jgi:serine protease DegQ
MRGPTPFGLRTTGILTSMDPDDELEDEGSSGPLLPPDDRLWRHPSEVAASVTRPLTAPARGGEPRVWAIALTSGVIGALLATGILFAAGVHTRKIDVAALEQDVDSTPSVTLAAANSPSTFVTGAERIRPSCVVLVARDSHGLRVSNGVVFRSDGMILASATMVTGATTLTATVDGRRQVSAKVIASDPHSDLAVVKLGGSGYTPAPLGSAIDLRVGDPVIAVRPSTDADGGGVPGDQGSVGALGQQITGPDGSTLSDMVQVLTTEPPSAVGGPVLDEHGDVVAIGTEAGPAGRAYEYALPVDLAREIATELLATGHVVPVWLGVEGVDLPAAEAKWLGVTGGAIVQRVYPDSPASAAGLEPGDIVIGVDGHEVSSMANLIVAVHAEPTGSHVELDVERKSGARSLMATVTPAPPGID